MDKTMKVNHDTQKVFDVTSLGTMIQLILTAKKTCYAGILMDKTMKVNHDT